ncbi:MAG TPA: hypothetical protein VFO29_11945 [Candidatus Rubrimentiphilum sp.]|nr:hypothetical protein [Candidatus Rubrimentiphilum sp.]
MNKAQRHQLAREIRDCGITEPVQLLPELLDDVQINGPIDPKDLTSHDAIFEFREISPDICYYMADDFSTEYKVQRKSSGITCGCLSFSKNRRHGCKHIGDFCRRHGLSDPTGGKAARRLQPTQDIYPIGPAQTTRKKQALRATPRLVRLLAYELCKSVSDNRPRTSKRGRPRVPLACCAYALLLKVAYNYTYEDLREVLTSDPNFRRLGWDYEEMPHWNTLSEIAAEPELARVFEDFLVLTSRPGRNLDYAIMLDGSGYGTTIRQNWMEQKFGRSAISAEAQHD